MSRTLIPDDFETAEEASTPPAPEIPAPEIPEPEVPAPEIPAPEIPAPEVPAPEVPAPEVPAPEIPAPEIPVPVPTPNTPSAGVASSAPKPVTAADLTLPVGPGRNDGGAGGKKGSAAGKILIGCGLVGVLSALLCCCGGGALITFAPNMMLSYFLEDQPLPGATTAAMPLVAASAKERACTALAAGEQITLSPDDVSVMALGGGSPDVAVLRIGAEGDRATMDFSLANAEEPPRYFNLHTRGAFKIEKGWFTDLKLDEFILSGHDWSAFVAGQQMATNANQSLANERAQNPDLGAVLDSTEYVAVEGGAFAVRLQPDGAAKRLLCDLGSLESLLQAQPTAPSFE